MTREEAIKILADLTDNLFLHTWEEQYKALHMAIEALQTEKTLKTQLANCHKVILRRLDFNYTTEKPNDVVDSKNDVVVEPTDLISRAELLDRIKAINSIPWGGDHGNAVKLVWSTEEVKRLIEKAPSADRPSGEWIPNHDGSWNCSECGLRVLIYAKGNYCPNCGAKMGGK